PEVVWFYNCMPVFPATLERLRKVIPACTLVQYANDDPFSAWRINPWRHLLAGIPLHDIHFAFRHANLDQYRQRGARRVALLRSYYIAEENFPESLAAADGRFCSDVAFVGHFEEDGRFEAMAQLYRAKLRVNLFGLGWEAALLRQPRPQGMPESCVPVYGAEYRKAICGAKIALCFLSHLNHDTYTTRNFEIPAMGTFLLSAYSDDLSTLFQEGVEAEFFRDPGELLDKTLFYLRHEAARTRVAAAGRARVLRDGHEVADRMRQALAVIASRPATAASTSARPLP